MPSFFSGCVGFWIFQFAVASASHEDVGSINEVEVGKPWKRTHQNEEQAVPRGLTGSEWKAFAARDLQDARPARKSRERRKKHVKVLEPDEMLATPVDLSRGGWTSNSAEVREAHHQMLKEKQYREEAALQRRRLTAKERRLKEEQERMKATAKANAERESEQRRVAQVKAEHRHKEEIAIARQEKRLAEKARQDLDRMKQKDALLESEIRREERALQTSKKSSAQAQRAGDYMKSLESATKDSQTKEAMRVQQAKAAAAAAAQRHQERTAKEQVRAEELAAKRADFAAEQAMRQEQHQYLLYRAQLRKRAVEQRKAAQGPSFFQIKRKRDLLLVWNSTNMDDLVAAFATAIQDDNYNNTMANISADILEAAAQFARREMKEAYQLEEGAANASAQEFIPVVASFFDKSMNLFQTHQRTMTRITERMAKDMASQLWHAIRPVTDLFQATRLPTKLNTTALSLLSAKVACPQLRTLFLRDLSPLLTTNITNLHKSLNATSNAIVSFLLVKNSGLDRAVTGAMQDLLHLGYIEVIALQDVSQAIRSMIQPLVESKCASLASTPKQRHASKL